MERPPMLLGQVRPASNGKHGAVGNTGKPNAAKSRAPVRHHAARWLEASNTSMAESRKARSTSQHASSFISARLAGSEKRAASDPPVSHARSAIQLFQSCSSG